MNKPNNTPARFVIIGSGLAGLNAAKAIREKNEHASIIMLSNENVLSYSRPLLTKMALRGLDDQKLAIHPQEFYDSLRIEQRLDCAAQEINCQEKWVLTSRGEKLPYDKLILATGAACFIPPIPGVDKKGVFVIRTLADAQAIRQSLVQAKNIVIIGGGVIGLEAAWEFYKLNKQLTILELAPLIMERLLDTRSSQELAQVLQDHGLQVRTGVSIAGIRGGEAVTSVELADGSSFPADLVLVSTGVRAITGLAQKAGVAIGRSIIVNSQMATNIPDVYACGDCAEYNGLNLGIVAQAIEQGKIAGANAAGAALEYAGVSSYVLLNAFNTSLFAVGDPGKKPDTVYETVVVEQTPNTNQFLVNDKKVSGPGFEQYYFAHQVLCGAVLFGDVAKIAAVREALENKLAYEKRAVLTGTASLTNSPAGTTPGGRG